MDRSLFAFVLCFYFRNHRKNTNAENGESVSIDVIDEVLSAKAKRVRTLIQPVVKRPAGLLLSDPRVAADLLLTMIIPNRNGYVLGRLSLHIVSFYGEFKLHQTTDCVRMPYVFNEQVYPQ